MHVLGFLKMHGSVYCSKSHRLGLLSPRHIFKVECRNTKDRCVQGLSAGSRGKRRGVEA
jgi:hypothetical protein